VQIHLISVVVKVLKKVIPGTMPFSGTLDSLKIRKKPSPGG
jgi:hypothetical protein